jgi:hypothetical protein
MYFEKNTRVGRGLKSRASIAVVNSGATATHRALCFARGPERDVNVLAEGGEEGHQALEIAGAAARQRRYPIDQRYAVRQDLNRRPTVIIMEPDVANSYKWRARMKKILAAPVWIAFSVVAATAELFLNSREDRRNV